MRTALSRFVGANQPDVAGTVWPLSYGGEARGEPSQAVMESTVICTRCGRTALSDPSTRSSTVRKSWILRFVKSMADRQRAQNADAQQNRVSGERETAGTWAYSRRSMKAGRELTDRFASCESRPMLHRGIDAPMSESLPDLRHDPLSLTAASYLRFATLHASCSRA